MIRCLQQHDPLALVVVPVGDGSARPLLIADVEAVSLREFSPTLYVYAADDTGKPGVLLK